ncbi:helix-turn-helix domain-containing protein [Alteromonas sp. a30]|uniref:helix-turn-helix domain-containing protein n=1 Tax=Alteromonas sp. a30 TaxID=2730917 RepID=UPI0022828FA1|nr:helix-turn-helix domain-containing protein [Alteromonas sp. a30]MCY7297196.1 helix-turn-helix domain-containing protein [Alteromonas sp. a30]
MKLNTPIDLGRVIRDERKNRQWTQAVLAEKAGLLQKDISRIENDTAKVNLQTLLGICAVLEIQLSALRNDSGNVPSTTLGF